MASGRADGTYLDSLSMFGIKPGLEATAELMRRVGNPEKGLAFLHIAGTNGKGSTGAMLECMLRSAGFTTGFYTSPHLVDIRERFRVNGLAVSAEDYEAISAELAEAARADTGRNFTFTYFEFTTVFAAMIFARAGVDVVVWETGMGGRLDATNVVRTLASIITNIALDHQAYLGDTVEKIAAEKAGIVKPGIPVFAGSMPDEAFRVIARKAEESSSECFRIPAGIPGPATYRFDGEKTVQEFDFEGRRITLPLPGAMQRRNFRLAAEVVTRLAPKLGLDLDRAFAGLADCRWPGRCQQVSERLIVDGGHNPDGISALKEALAEAFPGEKFAVLFAGFKDKDVAGSLRLLAPVAARFVFVPLAESDRPSYSGEELQTLAKEAGITAETTAAANAAAGLELAARDEKHRTLVSGSLYLAGEVLSHTQPETAILNLV
ncbi:Folylpolyglutamate synthase [bioreactor metagenome]|uniref:tetrahydrofolate synthase n=1 Tax=bioreactor metagenome TaxID=1076179 RepID=A0A645CQZ2_9ZZZZ